ncbi:Oidioi.mRNA.OKI2018_I69.XSR.g16842.t1.cds [Oikopleura dioica]|uniref:Oidioi.mRNA.OKI2018_I69.XSR.g16842.t1.cds n=1 Tax=Oikopleura dioica TaxID=34765 RepID=A0ABN7SHD9_OIKDI|nr:Oidioi.mRNA.OKI2018_I69.XSR.g16842.t1.cds [Oikopleura dioica]
MILKLLFLFLQVAVGTDLQKDLRECPDQDLAEICNGQCGQKFVECREACTDSICESECLASFSACIDSCPCYRDCPEGCFDCEHPLCFCKDPEITNPTYKQCIEEAGRELKDCVVNCVANKDCFDLCYGNFTVASERCPCMAECPGGCPCENGYNCQPFILALGEWRDHRISYVISSDGHFIENRHFDIPDGDGTYSYLESAGFSILNGEVYIFGENFLIKNRET